MGLFRRRRKDVSVDREVPEITLSAHDLIAYLKPYTFRLIFAIFALVGSAALSLVFPAIIGGIRGVPGILDTVLTDADPNKLNQITLFLIGIFFLRAVTTLIETYNLNYVGERIVMDIRQELYTHLHQLSLRFFIDQRVGELISRLSNDVTVMRGALTNNLTTLLQQSLILVGSALIMMIINWRLSLFILIQIPILVGIGFLFGYYLRRTSTAVQDMLAGATTIAEESFHNIREVKSFAREAYEIQRYKEAIVQSFQSSIRLLRIRAIFGSTGALLGSSGLALTVWFGGREVIAGRLTAGELVAFLIYGFSVGISFAALTNLYASFQEALGAMKRIFQILQLQPDLQDHVHAKILGQIEGRITFDHVSFSYDEQNPVLHNINLDIKPGEIIALVGPSGAGKSTMFNLIPRFYDPNQGQICIDGINLRDVTQMSLRQQIGTVPQETLLFGGTIRENILYGQLDASEEDLVAAATAANAHDFITGLPRGYQTIVGERGVRLSGGQRQRIAIARALLKNPRILLLDEATSSLDNESEHLIQEALSRLMQGRTTIIIAHRLSTVRIANRIVVLNEGRIVELGTHEELMANNNLYARLYEMQFQIDSPISRS